MIKPQKFKEQILRPQLEERLEGIILGAALLADSLSTREDRRNRIIQECNTVRQALQELLEEYIQYVMKNLIIFEIFLLVCFSRKRKVQMNI
jgi:catenin alpha